MNTSAPTCALCGQAVGGGEAARAVRDKFVCAECRRLVLATEPAPAPVLPYADPTVRKRRWLWPAVAAAALALAVAALLLLASQRAAMARARAAQMRALAAQRAAAVATARAAAANEAVRATSAQTQPAE